MRVGVLDIGSNSVLLLVGERTDAGWRVVTDQTRITRLGEGFGAARLLQPEAIERTLRAVDEYLAQCRALRVERVVAVATAVVREAVNPDAILQPLRERLPDDAVLRVLSEADEARLSYLSVALDETLTAGEYPISSTTPPSLRFPPLREGNQAPAVPPASRGNLTEGVKTDGDFEQLAVLDIGGGSVEVALGQGAQVQAWRSFPVGAGRVREAYMPSDPPSPREVLAATRALDEAFAPLRTLPQPDRVVSIGGTGVNLAMLALGLTAFDPAQVHGVWFSDETPAALLERLLRLSDAERRALPGIEPDRAPLLHVGALIVERALFALRREEVQISTRGLRYGILYELRENSPSTPQ
jgi:exopolyphosphatase/guanosine-5'-triphosphate,3'-diphosphate pyrophosphatase